MNNARWMYTDYERKKADFIRDGWVVRNFDSLPNPQEYDQIHTLSFFMYNYDNAAYDLKSLSYIEKLNNLKRLTVYQDWLAEISPPHQLVMLNLPPPIDYKTKFNWPDQLILPNLRVLCFECGKHNYKNIAYYTPNIELFEMDFSEHRNDNFIHELAKLPKIKYIEFFNVKSMDVFTPFAHSTLEEIYLRGRQGKSFPTDKIGNAKNLKHITINGLSAPLICDVFKELPKLETLSLDVHRLENEQALLEIPTLKEVEILYAYDEEERKQNFIKQCQEKRPDINLGSEIQRARRRKRAIDYS